MNTAIAILALVMLVLVLWMAYRIGKIILRVFLGLLFLGFAAAGIYYIYLRSLN